jgi:hypothetical protein
VNQKRVITSAACLLGLAAVSTIWFFKNPTLGNKNLIDDALLALIKNDQKGFEAFIHAGGDVHATLPAIDGKEYTVAQGVSYFERTGFAKHLHEKKLSYVNQLESADFDIMTISVAKNNPELLQQLALENPKFTMAYGKQGWTLLHMASAMCSHKLTAILHKTGKLSWDLKAKDGSTPLTLAAENDCLPMLSYWKEQDADFKLKDGRGFSALAILKKKKDAALAAFAESFESRMPSSVIVKEAAVPDFYKKRKIPKDQIIDHAAMIEPEDRPLEATETAENSEFAD